MSNLVNSTLSRKLLRLRKLDVCENVRDSAAIYIRCAIVSFFFVSVFRFIFAVFPNSLGWCRIRGAYRRLWTTIQAQQLRNRKLLRCTASKIVWHPTEDPYTVNRRSRIKWRKKNTAQNYRDECFESFPLYFSSQLVTVRAREFTAFEVALHLTNTAAHGEKTDIHEEHAHGGKIR